jgi:biopolymer transport protein ExbD
MHEAEIPRPPQTMGPPGDGEGDDSPVAHHDMVSHEKVTKKRLPKKMPELNIVPMLDVCFNLLIFFISTASFAVGEGVLPANMPVGQGVAQQDTDAPDQPIKIMLRSLGADDIAIEIEGSAVALGKDFNELFENLKRLQHNPENPNGIYSADDPVIIQPEGNVQWGFVVNAFNAAIRARYKKVNFAQIATK